MFNRIPGSVRVTLFFLLLGTCGVQIVRSATAAPVTEPVAKDEKKAERTAVSRVGGADVKDPLPPPASEVVGGNGVVEPAERETRVAAEVSAVVAKVLVKEGDHVEAGQLLVQLDDSVERAALAAAEADLEGEKANLAKALKGVRVEDRDAVAADVEAAKARAELSANVFARTQQLATSGATTPDELERTKRQAQTDAANLQASQARLRAAEAGSRREEISFQRARTLAAEAKVAQAKAQVDRLAVHAPAAGEVLQVKVRPGELYTLSGASDGMVVMGDTSRLRVRMDVDERDVAAVQVGASAYVTADAFGDRTFEGKVVEVGRRFGRKNVRTDDPIEKNDTKILETVLELEGTPPLIVGQRVVAFVRRTK